MKPTASFLKKLRRLDPALDVFFDWGRERWVIIRRYGFKYFGDGRVIRDVVKKRVIQDAEFEGRPLFSLADSGSRIGVVTGPDGGYGSLEDSVIEDLRARDMWNKDKREVFKAEDEKLAREDKALADRWEDGKADVNKTVMGLRNPKIDLGARSCR